MSTYPRTCGIRLFDFAEPLRACARDPELLVFDDLSSPLDVETERVLWERVFARGTPTCLVVSHRRAVPRRADHIVVLAGGQVAAEGTLAEVLVGSTEFRHMWEADASAR